MSSERTAAEAKADNIAKMGVELGTLYSALWQELAGIHKLWEDVLLHLARPTDPPKSMGKANLSIPRLTELIAASPIGNTTSGLANAALAKCASARDWRNRHLAHRDLDIALGQSVQPLAAASRQSVHDALAALVEVLNSVSAQRLGTTTLFTLGPGDDRDAEFLLHLLRDGLASRRERIERLARGEHRPGDFPPARL